MLKLYINEVIWYTFLCVWLLSFEITFLRFISVLFVLLVCSFLLTSGILLYTTVYFPVGGYLNCFQFCVIMNKAAINLVYKTFCRCMFSFWREVNIRMELLNNNVGRASHY